jgi:hypothetical protein
VTNSLQHHAEWIQPEGGEVGLWVLREHPRAMQYLGALGDRVVMHLGNLRSGWTVKARCCSPVRCLEKPPVSVPG